MVMYKKLTADTTVPAEVIKIASEIFSIAGVRQGPQEAGSQEPRFTISINLGGLPQPPLPPPMINVTPMIGPAFDDIVLAPEP